MTERTGQQRMTTVIDGPCAECGRPTKWAHSVLCSKDPTEAERLAFNAARARELSRQAQAKYRAKHGDARKPSKQTTCAIASCGKPLERQPGLRSYCSEVCKNHGKSVTLRLHWERLKAQT